MFGTMNIRDGTGTRVSLIIWGVFSYGGLFFPNLTQISDVREHSSTANHACPCMRRVDIESSRSIDGPLARRPLWADRVRRDPESRELVDTPCHGCPPPPLRLPLLLPRVSFCLPLCLSADYSARESKTRESIPPPPPRPPPRPCASPRLRGFLTKGLLYTISLR